MKSKVIILYLNCEITGFVYTTLGSDMTFISKYKYQREMRGSGMVLIDKTKRR